MVPGFTHTGTWYEYFTGQPFEVTDIAQANVSLKPANISYTPMSSWKRLRSIPALPEGVEEGRFMKVFPNPSEDFSIRVDLDNPARLTLEVYDLAGRKVDEIFNGRLQSGTHQFSWSGRKAGLSPGIYLLKAVTDDNLEVLKLIYR